MEKTKNKNSMEKQYALMPITLKGVDVKNHSLRAVFSTMDVDRHGDVVLQNWELDNFNANPVVLNSHNYGDATEVIGRAFDVRVVDGKLEGEIKFAVEENPKAKIIFDLYAGGFLNAFSAGFLVKEWADTGEMLKSELLEVSTVSVPANARALAKAKGINVDELYAKEQNGEGEQPDGGDDTVEDVEDTEPKKEESTEPSKDSETIREEELDELMEDTEEVETNEKLIKKALSAISENVKVETRSKSVRAKNARLINKAIRKLIKIKKDYA